MNSTLQLLRAVKELMDYFITGDAELVYRANENVNIAKEFHHLLRAWSSNEGLDEAHQKFT
jgi:hypothetical protein